MAGRYDLTVEALRTLDVAREVTDILNILCLLYRVQYRQDSINKKAEHGICNWERNHIIYAGPPHGVNLSDTTPGSPRLKQTLGSRLRGDGTFDTRDIAVPGYKPCHL